MMCPRFDVDTANVAKVLQTVDCMTQRTASGTFDRLFGVSGGLGTALTAMLTLYVGWLAIGLLTGRARLGLANLTPRMMTVGLVLTFATSFAAYQSVVWSLAVGAPDEIARLVTGTTGSSTEVLGRKVDRVFEAVTVVSDRAAQAASTAPTPAATADSTRLNLLWFSSLLLLLGTVGVLVTAKIVLGVLLALGPVFIVFALFAGTRGLFEGWVKATTIFALVPLFAVLLGGSALELALPVARAMALADEPNTRAIVAFFLITAVYVALMGMALKLATVLVSGWRPSIGAERGADTHTPSAPRVAPAPERAPPPVASPQDAERIRYFLSSSRSSASNSARSTESRVRLVAAPPTSGPTQAPLQSGAGDRARGVGSRFRLKIAQPTKGVAL